MSFGVWLLVFRQLHYITNREEIFIFNKKCRIYAALGVSQTPKEKQINVRSKEIDTE